MFHLFIYAISILSAIHGIQTRSIQNDIGIGKVSGEIGRQNKERDK
jgi:hypothetical protein